MGLRLFSLLVFNYLSITLLAQEKLKIEYEVIPYSETTKKSKLDITYITSKFELVVEKSISYYHDIPIINNEQNEKVGQGFSASFSASLNPVYKNTENRTYMEEAQIAEKKYLIKDKLPQIDWKITKETKEIAGYSVLKATAILSDEYKTKIEAWYSPKLNFKTGPDKFWGLPGIILEVQTEINYEDGSKEGMKYLATKIEVLKSNEKIKTLNKGKEITRENFDKLQIDFLQTQMDMYGGGIDTD